MTIQSQAQLTTALADNASGAIHATNVRDVVDTMFSLASNQVAAPPVSASATGTVGQFHIDPAAGKIYYCSATDTWVVGDVAFVPVP